MMVAEAAENCRLILIYDKVYFIGARLLVWYALVYRYLLMRGYETYIYDGTNWK
jgi:hypothetical protein